MRPPRIAVVGSRAWFDMVEEQEKRAEDLRERLRTGGPGSTSGGVTDDWKASVDQQLGQLHGDVRALLYGLIGGFLFLLGAGAFAYVKLADQQSDIKVTQAKTDAKIDLLLERTAPAAK